MLYVLNQWYLYTYLNITYTNSSTSKTVINRIPRAIKIMGYVYTSGSTFLVLKRLMK